MISFGFTGGWLTFGRCELILIQIMPAMILHRPPVGFMPRTSLPFLCCVKPYGFRPLTASLWRTPDTHSLWLPGYGQKPRNLHGAEDLNNDQMIRPGILSGGIRMKGFSMPICLLLAVVLLFPCLYAIGGQPAGAMARWQALPQDLPGSGWISSTSEAPAIELMTPVSAVQQVGIEYERCFNLLLIYLMGRILWRKPRSPCIPRDKNKRFAVEGKTSHPQQAPPFHLLSAAAAL
jgi:hypothetical protein